MMCLPAIDGQVAAAVWRWWARRCSIASRLSGAAGPGREQRIARVAGAFLDHAVRIRLIGGVSGVRLAFLPLPMVWTLAPVLSVMSWQVSATSSEIRKPVWIVSASIAWSRGRSRCFGRRWRAAR